MPIGYCQFAGEKWKSAKNLPGFPLPGERSYEEVFNLCEKSAVRHRCQKYFHLTFNAALCKIAELCIFPI